VTSNKFDENTEKELIKLIEKQDPMIANQSL